MSSPFCTAVMASDSCSYVYFVPGGPDTSCSAAAMSAPSVDPAASEASASRITASKFWAS